MSHKLDDEVASTQRGAARAVAHRLTARTAGAIAVIAVTGKGAGECVGQLWHSAPQLSAGVVKRAALTFQGQEIDDALIVCRNSQYFEIHAHGGTAVVEQILDALRTAGAEAMPPNPLEKELLALAGVHSRGLAPAILREVLAALPEIDNSFALHLLANQHEQGLALWAQRSARLLREWPNVESLWHVQAQAQWILQCEKFLRHFLHPPRIALIGQPNAGKSTLLNTLAGRSASITSDTAGTTRDWVDVTVRLTAGAISLNAVVVDTAGIRATADPLERESILRSHQQTQHADVVVLVLDGAAQESTALAAEHQASGSSPSSWIYAINKMDIARNYSGKELPVSPRSVGISALRGEGMGDLHQAILESLGVLDCNPAMALVWTARQREIIHAISMVGSGKAAMALLADLAGIPRQPGVAAWP